MKSSLILCVGLISILLLAGCSKRETLDRSEFNFEPLWGLQGGFIGEEYGRFLFVKLTCSRSVTGGFFLDGKPVEYAACDTRDVDNFPLDAYANTGFIGVVNDRITHTIELCASTVTPLDCPRANRQNNFEIECETELEQPVCKTITISFDGRDEGERCTFSEKYFNRPDGYIKGHNCYYGLTCSENGICD